MKIRVVGTRSECAAVVDVLALVLDLLEVSPSYPNRPPSRLVRVYIDARPKSRGGRS